MPGDLKAPGMYYEKVILLLTSARLIKLICLKSFIFYVLHLMILVYKTLVKKECLTNEGFLKDK